MSVRLGAVQYLNARPLVYGLDADPQFTVRFDIPSRCAELLHAHEIDLGLIPSIEYLRGPRSYGIVPGPAVASMGAVASVALYSRRDLRDVRTIAMDTSSKTSVALTLVVVKRTCGTVPQSIPAAPDLAAMLATADAALMIGDNALLLEAPAGVQKIDLGQLWTDMTGLPFVYAFWAGWPRAVTPEQVGRLERARDEGVAHIDDIARGFAAGDPQRELVASRYLRDNIQYELQTDGLTTFYRYAAEDGLVDFDGSLNFYHADR
ncbi:MAG TPA: menaquinone biosynthesis protein [Vicinamibacterales bacterium]|jgi:predicted solute-binding protein|nr:menaquinone biosynthesis protein [Vicinamibacterales bacterium]